MKAPRKPPAVRTTISLAKVINDLAEEMMAKRGFNGHFSAYIADLIRRDKEREAGQTPTTEAPN